MVRGPRGDLRYRWEWELQASPEALWPLVSDTNRFNFETGAPRVEPAGIGPDGTRQLRATVLRRELDFEEQPFEWVRPERFGVVRRYRSGPIAELEARLALSPRNGGSELVYELRVTPRGAAGRAVVPLAIGRVARARMDEAFRRYDRLLAGADVPLPPRARPRLAPGGRERLLAQRERLVAGGSEPGLVTELAEMVETGDEIALTRLRPYALADAWNAERRQVLELSLAATRVGLLESRWEVLCPLCRGAASSAGSLGDIELHAHCDSCDVEVEADLDRSLELVFRPHPAVRELAVTDFCVAGPGVTPHVIAQQRLAPGERRTLQLPLEPGVHRIRARGVPGGETFAVAGGELTTVELVNEASEERLYVVERTAWSDQAATAADVTSLQAFRDLFSSEALRPGEELAVGSLTVVFTDLQGSTRLYREIGDAPAYGSVIGHFDVLREAIAEEGGALVKTIGDAVMAVFRRPVSSLRAVLAAQAQLAGPPTDTRPLRLKAGIHTGPCIAVTLNDRLDYFGSTVNAAARIVGLSSGKDVVISAAMREDPEVADLLAGGGFHEEPVEAELRGFENERFELWRLVPHG